MNECPKNDSTGRHFYGTGLFCLWCGAGKPLMALTVRDVLLYEALEAERQVGA